MNDDLVDLRYYRAVSSGSFSERLLVIARDRIYKDFLRRCVPRRGEAILDVGASDVVTDGANFIERLYSYPEDITAVGLGSGEDFRAAYPRAHYNRIEADKPLPYADSSFRIAVSNAVLEHVGSVPAQEKFLRELMRVADRVYVTVPNRFFLVEHHTAIPLAHWADGTFHLVARAFGQQEWLKEENLILMTRSRLLRLLPPGLAADQAEVGVTGLALGPFSSNLFLHISR